MSEDEAKPVKTVLIGEAGVGKTCIISRFVNNIYDDNTMSNINPAFSAKTMKFNAFGGKELRYDLWDTAGQEKYKSIAKFLYKDAQVIIFVYDITRIDSFDEIKNYWYKEVKENCNKGVILGLAGNKCDLFEREEVTEKQGKELYQLLSNTTKVIERIQYFHFNQDRLKYLANNAKFIIYFSFYDTGAIGLKEIQNHGVISFVLQKELTIF